MHDMIRNAIVLGLVCDKILTAESSVLLSQTLTMSISKYSVQPQRQVQRAKVLVVLHYAIDLLDVTYNILKTALSRNEAKSSVLIKCSPVLSK